MITICTPTYNRAHTLPRLYDSLCKQTSLEFEWIVVDDGSSDRTKDLIDNWMKDRKINIKYYYQRNRGKHIAHNLGVEKASAPLFTCLDSDDWFYEDTIEKILSFKQLIINEQYCGIIGIDTYKDNKLVGDYFPEQLISSNWKDLMFKHRIKGDKTIIFKTEILKKYPFPENADKHMPPSFQLFKMSEFYKFYLTNNHLKYVEYLPDGITANIRKKYEVAPNNYMSYRLLIMDIVDKKILKAKNAILFNIAKIHSGKRLNQLNIPNKHKKYLITTYPLALVYIIFFKKKEKRK